MDSSLPIVQEALDPKGRWRSIEQMSRSFSGNTSHRLFLPAGHYWEFIAPRYTGSYRTKLRFRLNGKQVLHSNEFDGSVNLEQFGAD